MENSQLYPYQRLQNKDQTTASYTGPSRQVKIPVSHLKSLSSASLGNINHHFQIKNTTSNNPENEGYDKYKPHNLKMQVLGDRLSILADKRQQERENLLQVVNKNIAHPNSSNPFSVGYVTRRDTMMGIKPLETEIDISTFKNNSTATNADLKRRLAVPEIIPHKYDEDSKSSDEDVSPPSTRNNINKHNRVMSVQALDEIKDNMEIFKMDIENNIRKLQKNQDKIQLGELRKDFISLGENVEKEMKKVRIQADKEYTLMRDGFTSFKDEVLNTLSGVTKNSNEVLNTLGDELTGYHGEINKRILGIEDRQKLHFDQLKFLLENVTDDRTKALAGKFLVENQEEFEKNKKSYIRPSGHELKQAITKIQSGGKSVQFAEELSRNEVLMKSLSKRKQLNENLAEDTMRDLKVSDKANPEEIRELHRVISEKVSAHLANTDDEITDSKITKFKKAVDVVLACNRLNKLLELTIVNKIDTSLDQFSKFYSHCDELLRNFVNDSIKVSLTALIKSDSLNLDLTEYKSLSKKKNDTQVNDRFIKLVARVKGFLENLIENTTADKLGPQLIAYLKFLVTNEKFIPFKMFTLFEHSRIEMKHGMTKNIKEKHTAMILCFYIINKTLVKYILIDQSFLAAEARRKLPDNIVKNLKIIASVIFHDTIDMFRKTCPVINNIENYDEYCASQKFMTPPEKKTKSDLGKENHNKKYSSPLREWPQEILEKLERINSKIPDFSPDIDVNCPDFLQNCLYMSHDLKCYATLAAEKKIELAQKVFIWVKQLIQIIKL